MCKENKKYEIRNLCKKCDNCWEDGFCIIKNEFVEDFSVNYCDEFYQYKKHKVINSGFSVIDFEQKCLKDSIVFNIINIDKYKIIFFNPYFIEYDFYDNNFIAFDENLEIFTIQPSIEMLKKDFITQISEKILLKNTQVFEKFKKIGKIEVINEKD